MMWAATHSDTRTCLTKPSCGPAELTQGCDMDSGGDPTIDLIIKNGHLLARAEAERMRTRLLKQHAERAVQNAMRALASAEMLQLQWTARQFNLSATR